MSKKNRNNRLKSRRLQTKNPVSLLADASQGSVISIAPNGASISFSIPTDEELEELLKLPGWEPL